jgi:hypothetical protein
MKLEKKKHFYGLMSLVVTQIKLLSIANDENYSPIAYY